MEQALVRVLLPVAAPSIVTTLIFVFINSWNEYTIALTLISGGEDGGGEQILPLDEVEAIEDVDPHRNGLEQAAGNQGEERWIFPYQENADAMFNSSLIFELGVMKEFADEILKGVPRDMPEYAEAFRLRKLLSYFTPITDRLIPSTSLLREFLGGSSFHY